MSLFCWANWLKSNLLNYSIRSRFTFVFVQLMAQREEAWKKIHLRALENPIKDQLTGYDVAFLITVNDVRNTSMTTWPLWLFFPIGRQWDARFINWRNSRLGRKNTFFRLRFSNYYNLPIFRFFSFCDFFRLADGDKGKTAASNDVKDGKKINPKEEKELTEAEKQKKVLRRKSDLPQVSPPLHLQLQYEYRSVAPEKNMFWNWIFIVLNFNN